MNTTIQLIMAGLTVAGYMIGHLHAWMASPIGSDTLKALSAVVEQNKLLEGHAKLQKLAQGGIAVAKVIPIVDAALHGQATGASNAGPKA